jgi:hypothetical protein
VEDERFRTLNTKAYGFQVLEIEEFCAMEKGKSGMLPLGVEGTS